MKNITSIDNLLLSKNTVVYFYKPEINYHEKFQKMMKSLEEELGVELYTFNLQLDPSVSKRFDFKSLPCVIYFKNKKLFKKHEGMTSYSNLKKVLKLSNC